jgi:hypothetical protein
MELTWLMKLRIAAAAVIGVVLIGIISWPSQSSPDPFGSLVFKQIGTNAAVTLLIMAFLAGLISYFAAWPYGREIGILAVPFGLCVWAVHAGSTGALLQLNPTISQRQEVLSTLRLEPLFWLLVLACGFAGVLFGQRIEMRLKKRKQEEQKNIVTPAKFGHVILSMLLSVVIAVFCIGLFARDVTIQDKSLNSVVAQPATGQIVFAVLLSFGIAAFAVKLFLDVNYIWPTISCAIVSYYAISRYMNNTVLERFVEHYPAIFFPNAVISILPVQIVTFGAIGSVIGYWMAVRSIYWRKHEM